MSGHTPTPWEHTGGDIWIDTREQVCCGRGHHECCGNPDVSGGQELVAQTGEANAAFIVLAVNSHDALVKALEDTKRSLLSEFGQRIYDVNFPQIDAALLLAKGERG